MSDVPSLHTGTRSKSVAVLSVIGGLGFVVYFGQSDPCFVWIILMHWLLEQEAEPKQPDVVVDS